MAAELDKAAILRHSRQGSEAYVTVSYYADGESNVEHS